MFDNIREDLPTMTTDGAPRHFGYAGLSIRSLAVQHKAGPVRKFFSMIYKVPFKLMQIVAGIELPCKVVLGRNFIIDHFGGIVISGYAKFGDNCRIRNGVVVGLRRVGDNMAPSSAITLILEQARSYWDRYALVTTY